MIKYSLGLFLKPGLSFSRIKCKSTIDEEILRRLGFGLSHKCGFNFQTFIRALSTINALKNCNTTVKLASNKILQNIRMAQLPLRNISHNTSEKTLLCNSDDLKLKSAQTIPLKNILKRKSLECYDSSSKENVSNSEKLAKRERTKPFTVSVEGNIGSGKSTFLKYFSSRSKVATYQEPIDQWTNLKGHNLLGKLYENPERWSFLFQSFVQLTRLKIHIDNDPNIQAKLIERSFHNNRYCFLESAYDSGELKEAEFNILSEYYDFFEKHLDIDIDLIVYLRTSPEVVYERMKKRGRSEEATVSLDYIKKIHKYYERWLRELKPKPPSVPVLEIDGDLDTETLFKEYDAKLPYILGEKTVVDERATKSIVKLFDSDNESQF